MQQMNEIDEIRMVINYMTILIGRSFLYREQYTVLAIVERTI